MNQSTVNVYEWIFPSLSLTNVTNFNIGCYPLRLLIPMNEYKYSKTYCRITELVKAQEAIVSVYPFNLNKSPATNSNRC